MTLRQEHRLTAWAWVAGSVALTLTAVLLYVSGHLWGLALIAPVPPASVITGMRLASLDRMIRENETGRTWP